MITLNHKYYWKSIHEINFRHFYEFSLASRFSSLSYNEPRDGAKLSIGHLSKFLQKYMAVWYNSKRLKEIEKHGHLTLLNRRRHTKRHKHSDSDYCKVLQWNQGVLFSVCLLVVREA